MLNIVISINENYIDPARTMLFSLRQHVASPVAVWMLNHALTDQQIEEWKRYLEENHMEFHRIEIDSSRINNLPIFDKTLFSIETYYRLMIPWVIPEEIERVLWLDADIVITGDLTSFYQMEFKEDCLVVCEDRRQWIESARKQDGERMNLDEAHRYFNAGVLLMNLEKIRKTITLEDVFKAAEQFKDRLYYQDQDLLNYLFQNQVGYAKARCYNCDGALYDSLSEDERKQVRILHYYGRRKPWHMNSFYDADLQYWKIKRKQGQIVLRPFILNYFWKKARKSAWLKAIYIRWKNKGN